MSRNAVRIAVLSLLATTAMPAEEPDGLLPRFLSKLKEELAKLPDYVCTQTVKRMSRADETRAWESMNLIRMDVALVGETELYGKPGAKSFEKRPIAQWPGQGAFSTGKFGSLAKHLFFGAEAHFQYKGESERDGSKSHEYSYDVAPERSSYRLKAGDAEETVGFQGSFWIDAASLDLIELDVQAYDIPQGLGLSEAGSILSYRRLAIGDAQVLLPVMTTLDMVSADGAQNRNVTRIDSCRQYGAESSIRFAGQPEAAPAEVPAEAEDENDGTQIAGLVELQLETAIDPSKAAAGNEVRARVTKPLREGGQILIPEGAVATGRLVRVDRQGALPVYEIALEFDTLWNADQQRPFAATLVRTGPGSGLVKHARNMMPRSHSPGRARMSILVSEVRQGQGAFLWDVRKGAIPRGFRMKWRMQEREWSALMAPKKP